MAFILDHVTISLLSSQNTPGMKIKLDTLKCVKLMTQHGLPTENAEAIVSGLTAMEIDNVYANTEIDNMIDRLSEKFRREIDSSIANAMARQDEKYEHRFDILEAGITDLKSYFRWVVGTILGANTAISASIIAYLHFFH